MILIYRYSCKIVFISEKKTDKHIEPDLPFEWVEFRRPDGK